MITLALLGKDGGKLKGMCDYELIIPGETTDRIQEIHMLILHSIIEEVERILFPSFIKLIYFWFKLIYILYIVFSTPF